MSRLDELRAMRDFITREIQIEELARFHAIRTHPVLTHVSHLYDVDVDLILLGDRTHRVTRARHAAAWLFRRQDMTLDRICHILGYGSKAMGHKAIARVEGDASMKALLLGLEVAS